MHPKTMKCRKPVINIVRFVIIMTITMMMIIMILINVITILHYLLITKNNIFHVFEKKEKQKQKKNNITLCKRSLVVCARTNFSEGIPSLMTLIMIMIIKSLIIYHLLIHAAICM